MSVGDSDLQHLYSASAGSTGGAITGSGPTSGVKNDVWADVLNAARLAGGTSYIKTFFKNNHGTDDWLLPIMYIPLFPVNMTLLIGLGVNASTDDDPLQGNMTAFGAGARVALISDGADTRVCNVWGIVGGVATMEQVTLTGAVEVLSVATFTTVWRVDPASTSATRTVLVKQGTGGTVRGTIGPNKRGCFLWVSAGTAIASGIKLPNLAAGQSYGCWRKLSWTAGAGAVKPDELRVKVEGD